MEAVTGRLILDEHVASVVEFMERNLPVDRLEYVATRLPAIARVLWSEDRCANRERQSIASGCIPAAPCVDGDSVAVEDAGARRQRTSHTPRNGKSRNTVSEFRRR
jgi:hypothetical protein